MTLREIVDNILTTWGKIDFRTIEYEKWFNTIAQDVRNHAALYIRRDIERNGISQQFYQTYQLELEKKQMTSTDCKGFGCLVLRSKNKIPEYIRLNAETSFKYVGNIDRTTTFTYTSPEYLEYAKHSRVLRKVLRYDIIDSYLYLFGNTKMKYALIEAIWLNSKTDGVCTSVSCANDMEEFPVSADIIEIVKEQILGILRNNLDKQL